MRSALAAVLFLPLAAFPGETWDLITLMRHMAQVTESRSRFVETRHLALLTRPLELKGSLSYERPNRLAKHVQSPFDELLSVDGDSLTVRNNTRGESFQLSLSEQPAAGALVESVRATLAGDLARLERHYEAALSGTRADWRLRLVPRDAQLRKYVETISLAGAGERLTRIETVEAGGDRSVMMILHDGK